jgi:hypothetical protein
MSDQKTEKSLADILYEQVKKSFTTAPTAANVVNLITATMMAAEKLPKISGPAKKELVTSVVDRFVGEIPDSVDAKPVIKASVVLLLPSIVDTIVSAAKGQLDINAAKTSCC